MKIQNGLSYISRDIRGCDEVKVGSVENFQGGERDVIIVSMVRSHSINTQDDSNANLSFINNEKVNSSADVLLRRCRRTGSTRR